MLSAIVASLRPRQWMKNLYRRRLSDTALLVNTLGWIFAVLLIIYGARLE